MMIVVPAAKAKFLLPKDEWNFALSEEWPVAWMGNLELKLDNMVQTPNKMSLAKAWVPYILVALFLVLSRIPELGINTMLKSVTFSISNLFDYQTIRQKVDEDRIFTDKATTLAYGTDASFYRLIPKIVIQSFSVEEVSFLIKEANEMGLPITFRAAGTSLSGQAITDSILILTARHWTGNTVLEEGKKITL